MHCPHHTFIHQMLTNTLPKKAQAINNAMFSSVSLNADADANERVHLKLFVASKKSFDPRNPFCIRGPALSTTFSSFEEDKVWKQFCFPWLRGQMALEALLLHPRKVSTQEIPFCIRGSAQHLPLLEKIKVWRKNFLPSDLSHAHFGTDCTVQNFATLFWMTFYLSCQG